MKFLILLCLLLFSCGGSNMPDVGSEAVLYLKGSEVVLLADSKPAYKQFIKIQTAKDKHGFNQMVSAGKIFAVPNGTRVLILDLDLAAYEVRILQGEHKNRTGWIAYEFAKKAPQ